MPQRDAQPAPADWPTFLGDRAQFSELTPPPPPDVSALQRLGPSPFGKSRPPFLGFLASVYDHVAERAAASERK